MPYGRGYRQYGGYRNDRYNRGNGGYNGGYKKRRPKLTYGSMGQKVFEDTSWLVNKVHQLSGLINTEFKKIDVTDAATVSTTASIVVINPSVVGDDFDNRDGRKIRIKSVQLTLTAAIGVTTTFTFVRVLIVIDKQPNEIQLVITDLLDFANITSHRNLDGRKRFAILFDQILELNQEGKRTAVIKWYKKLDMITIYDDSNAGTIVDITSNALYLIISSDETTLVPFITRTTRVRFIDN